MRRKMKKLGAKADCVKLNHMHPAHEEYRSFRNRYTEEIKNAKSTHWADWLTNMSDSDIWKASHLVTGPPSDVGRSWVPTLKAQLLGSETSHTIVEDNDSKGHLFSALFSQAGTTPPRMYWNIPCMTKQSGHLLTSLIHR